MVMIFVAATDQDLCSLWYIYMTEGDGPPFPLVADSSENIYYRMPCTKSFWRCLIVSTRSHTSGFLSCLIFLLCVFKRDKIMCVKYQYKHLVYFVRKCVECEYCVEFGNVIFFLLMVLWLRERNLFSFLKSDSAIQQR